MIRGVLEGLYQIGIGYLPNGYSELEARELLNEDIMVCIPSGFGQEQKTIVTVAEFEIFSTWTRYDNFWAFIDKTLTSGVCTVKMSYEYHDTFRELTSLRFSPNRGVR
jgi:hypothetical protein